MLHPPYILTHGRAPAESSKSISGGGSSSRSSSSSSSSAVSFAVGPRQVDMCSSTAGLGPFIASSVLIVLAFFRHGGSSRNNNSGRCFVPTMNHPWRLLIESLTLPNKASVIEPVFSHPNHKSNNSVEPFQRRSGVTQMPVDRFCLAVYCFFFLMPSQWPLSRF
jgi:hypothetical protein